MICAGSDSLHAEMIYAKSLAAAMFTFGNAGLEVSKAKPKGRQTPVSETCCGTWSFFFFFPLSSVTHPLAHLLSLCSC